MINALQTILNNMNLIALQLQIKVFLYSQLGFKHSFCFFVKKIFSIFYVLANQVVILFLCLSAFSIYKNQRAAMLKCKCCLSSSGGGTQKSAFITVLSRGQYCWLDHTLSKKALQGMPIMFFKYTMQLKHAQFRVRGLSYRESIFIKQLY